MKSVMQLGTPGGGGLVIPFPILSASKPTLIHSVFVIIPQVPVGADYQNYFHLYSVPGNLVKDVTVFANTLFSAEVSFPNQPIPAVYLEAQHADKVLVSGSFTEIELRPANAPTRYVDQVLDLAPQSPYIVPIGEQLVLIFGASVTMTASTARASMRVVYSNDAQVAT